MSVEIVLTIGVIILVIYGVLIQESDIDITVKRSKTLEGRLKRELNAKGDGLGKLTESVKEKLPDEIYQKLVKTIIPARNEIVHTEGQNILKDRKEFIQSCDSVESKLDELKQPKRAKNNRLGCLIVFSIIAAVIYFVSQNPL